MDRRISILLALFLFLAPVQAAAQLAAVSGKPNPAADEVLPNGSPADVAVSLANGFPLWYRDANGLKLELCLDQEVPTAGGTIFPCFTAEPFPGAPISFPDNFGPEAFWWAATASTTFSSIRDGLPAGGGDALLVLAQEAAFSQGIVSNGAQVAFGRMRIRINAPVAGTYRVSHPYGTVDYVVPAAGPGREINQTQDVGVFPLDFVASLRNGPDQTQPPGFNPAVIPPTGAIVASAPVNIGPFLTPVGGAGAFVTALDGRRYVADPGFGVVQLTQPVTGSPTGDNFFRIELLSLSDGSTPGAGGDINGFFLNAANSSQVVEVTEFQLMGKLFDDAPNLAPVAAPDVRATAVDTSVVIDAAANDTDPVGAGNAHGLNRQALGLVSGAGILLTEPLTTAGGSVQRIVNFSSGRASFLYTPRAGFTGVDTFDYVVQDTGGRISAPATVTVTVEDLKATKAEYRPRLGKWRVEGTSSDRTANAVTLYTSPRGRLSGASEAPAVATSARGTAALKVAADAVEFTLGLDVLPATAVTQVHVHVGAPGQNGPVVFVLYDGAGPFTGALNGILTPNLLVPRPASGINTFADVVEAILSGNAYVNVHTEANPGGEIRGQLQLATVGAAPVDPATGRWSFFGKSRTVPSLPTGIVVESDNGIRIPGVPLRMR